MRKIPAEAGSAGDVDDHARRATQSRFKLHLLAGVATVALLAAGSAYTLHAYSADAHLGGTPFGASSAARVPATPISLPGFADLVTAVRPAVVSVRGPVSSAPPTARPNGLAPARPAAGPLSAGLGVDEHSRHAAGA